MRSGDAGQITIEALLVFGMMILVLVSISWPMAFRAKAAADDLEMVSGARYAAEQIASAANSISAPGGKRTIDIYIPGYRSPGNATGGRPLVHIGTRICTDGDNLNTTVIIMRRDSDGTETKRENHNFTRGLIGTGWSFSAVGGDAIWEETGRRYSLMIYWKNITTSTSNSASDVTCTTVLPPADF